MNKLHKLFHRHKFDIHLVVDGVYVISQCRCGQRADLLAQHLIHNFGFTGPVRPEVKEVRKKFWMVTGYEPPQPKFYEVDSDGVFHKTTPLIVTSGKPLQPDNWET